MNREQALKEISKLNEAAEALKNIEADIRQAKGEKSVLQREIKALENAKTELEQTYRQDKDRKCAELSALGQKLSETQNKQASIIAQAQSERSRLELVMEQCRISKANLQGVENSLNARELNLTKINQKLEEKLSVINQIKKLIESL